MTSELQALKEALAKHIAKKKMVELKNERGSYVTEITNEVVNLITPAIQQMAESARLSKEDIKQVAEEVASRISIPDIHVPELPNIPDVRVSIDTTGIEQAVERAVQNVRVNVPPITVPPLIMPSRMNVGMEDFSNARPLPVRMMDAGGKPMEFTMGGGGKMDYLTIKGIMGSAWGSIVNPDGRLLVEMPTGASGLSDAELRASSVPVSQVSGANWSVMLSDVFATTSASTVVNPDNRVRVELPAGASGLTDLELRASSVPVAQASGAVWSTTVTNTVPVTGTFWQATQPVSGTVAIGAGSAAIGSVNVNGSTNSTISVGPTLHDAPDVGSAPQKVGGVAVTTANPAAVAGGDVVNFRADDLGRQVMRPIQVRDLIASAYVSLTTGTETVLLAGAASTFHDLIYVMAANQSNAAALVDFRCGTAGAIVMSLEVPANGTAGVSLNVPHLMPEVAQAWTADLEDITGTTVDITAQFSKEI